MRYVNGMEFNGSMVVSATLAHVQQITKKQRMATRVLQYAALCHGCGAASYQWIPIQSQSTGTKIFDKKQVIQ